MRIRPILVGLGAGLALALAFAQGAAAASPGAGTDDKSMKQREEEARVARRPVTSIAARLAMRAAGNVESNLSPLVVLYDQNTSVNLNSTSQNFEAAYDAYDNQGADDFVVTGGNLWNVTTVFAPGAYSATHGTPTTMHVAFYQNNAGVPGAAICDFPALPFVEAPVGTFTLTLPGGCLLSSGLKWVSVQANLDYAAGAGGQWFWATRTVLTNGPSRWQNPGNGFATGCTTWSTRTACLGQTDPDFAFTLSGDVLTCSTDAECSDGTLCTGVETCVAGACQPGTPVDCDDGQVCTLDTCDPGTGQCSHPANPCNDGDACTLDSCSPASGCVHVTPAPVQFCNTGAITIPATAAPGTPYPSSIVVSGLPPSSALCSVQLQGVSHTWPDDIDVLLVGPLGGASNAIIMSDVGGSTDAVGANLLLKDAAAASLPDGGPIVSGTFKPTNVSAGDTFAAPAPAPAGGSALSVFAGTDPNGTWNLFVVDDAASDAGSFAGGWCLNLVVTGCANDAECSDGNLCNGVETCSGGSCVPGTPVNCDDGQFCTLDSCTPATGECVHAANPCDDGDACTADFCDVANAVCSHLGACVEFCNPGLITINDTTTPPTAGTPYPSSIVVSGLGPLAVVGSVQLLGVNHTYPDDIDIMLVGPGGAQNATIMSDVGGGTDLVAVDLDLSDGAAAAMPDGGPLVSGSYKPTNAEAAADVFPAPAPVPLGGSALTVFTGNPNGSWNLFVSDDTGVDSGTITDGWCINIRPLCASDAECDDGNPCTNDTCAGTLCTHTNNSAPCDDGNTCTTGDTCSGGSCAPGTPVGPPAAVGNSVRLSKVAASAQIDWSDAPGPYNVYRGSRPAAGPFTYDHTCFAPDVAGSPVDDGALPGAGDTFYYLVTRENACGESVPGYDSVPAAIPNASPCP